MKFNIKSETAIIVNNTKKKIEDLIYSPVNRGQNKLNSVVIHELQTLKVCGLRPLAIFSELVFLILLRSLISQRRSLWSSLIVIPMRIIIIFMRRRWNYYSGLIIILYRIIFIGGLLVLLVRVASISFQEQSFNIIKVWLGTLLILIIPVILSFKRRQGTEALPAGIIWFANQPFLFYILILIIVAALLLITKLVLSFKGIIRSL